MENPYISLVRIGNDVFGKHFKEYLRSVGVKDLTLIDKLHNTGICVSFIYENGERTMIVNKGANDYLSVNDISSCIYDIANSKIFYFSGYSLISKNTYDATMYAVKEASKNGSKVYFNPGAPNIINENFRQIIEKFVDILILNIDEAKVLSGEDDIHLIADILTKGVKLAVITLNKQGALVCKRGDIYHVPTTPINARDTTGAGDAFAAGFIAGKIRGLNDYECVKLGNFTALNFLKEKNSLFR